MNFFDPATGQLHETSFRSQIVASFPKGWLIAVDDYLTVVDFTGKPLARLVFQWDGKKPTEAQWIMPDGSLLADTPSRGLIVTWIQDRTIRTLPLDQARQLAPFTQLPTTSKLEFLK